MMRIDRFLVIKGIGSRKEVQNILKKEIVLINGSEVRDPKFKVIENDVVELLGYTFKYKKYVYYLLNKPQGCVSATIDKMHPTVIDILNNEDFRIDIFPVGRLDLDTTGLLILTNDGQLAHQLLAPKRHVDKVYAVTIKGKLDENQINKLENGVDILDGYVTKPAKVNVIEDNLIHLTISEGKFHQVKEMLKAVDNDVIKLERIKFGRLDLPKDLKEGEYLKINKQDLL